jgi:hypothetical protein
VLPALFISGTTLCENIPYKQEASICTYHDCSKVALAVGNGIVNEGCVLRHGCCLEDERRVCGCVLRLDTLDGVHITSVCHDNGELLELLVLVRHGTVGWLGS